jgi:HAD superfamily hydrolase (TIGR01509 family)
MPTDDIQGLIFDFGGVFTVSAPVNAWLRGYDALLGLPPDSIHATLFSGETWEEASMGHISHAEYWRRAGQPFVGRLPADFLALQRGLFHIEPINEETVTLVKFLRAHTRPQLPIALCSNALADLREVLEERPDVRDLFDVIVVSAEAGLRKPNPAILTLTAERLGLLPARCLFIDDKERNTNAAATIGMPGIVFESAEQLQRALAERGLWPA